MPSIDLNCDLGEGAGHDRELMALVSSANIACGAHAGDATSMEAAVVLARSQGVAVGAHPGFADRENFGRRELPVWPDEVYQLVLAQTRTLERIAQARGVRLAHVKPHGALYNMAARNTLLAAAVAQAVYEVDPRLRLFGLAGSQSLAAGRACGLEVSSEVFADRTYQPDGSLTPRGRGDALIADDAEAAHQVLRMIREGKVRAVDGTDLSIRVDTVCVHGDGAHALSFARRLRQELEEAGFEIRNPGHG